MFQIRTGRYAPALLDWFALSPGLAALLAKAESPDVLLSFAIEEPPNQSRERTMGGRGSAGPGGHGGTVLGGPRANAAALRDQRRHVRTNRQGSSARRPRKNTRPSSRS